MSAVPRITWPEGKKFAFTVFDDTDLTTVHNGPPLYGFLHDCGVITTKSVWPIKGGDEPVFGGSTCADEEYLAWVRQLAAQGFEIGYHNATFHSSKRPQAIGGLTRFVELFGHYPNVFANHAWCMDSIHWGDERLSGLNKLAYNLLTRYRHHGQFRGTDEFSEYFWGDKCKERVRYVRNFVYSDINTLKACPAMPYHDKDRPFVNYWFASSEGANCRLFCRTVSEENQDRLEEEGGACIMYTHFGREDFLQNGRLDPEFVRLMQRLSKKNGWFVPVSTLLDHILKQRGDHVISSRERTRLERKWLMEKVFRGTT